MWRGKITIKVVENAYQIFSLISDTITHFFLSLLYMFSWQSLKNNDSVTADSPFRRLVMISATDRNQLDLNFRKKELLQYAKKIKICCALPMKINEYYSLLQIVNNCNKYTNYIVKKMYKCKSYIAPKNQNRSIGILVNLDLEIALVL